MYLKSGLKGFTDATPTVFLLVPAGDTRWNLKSHASFPRKPIASPLLASKSSVTRPGNKAMITKSNTQASVPCTRSLFSPYNLDDFAQHMWHVRIFKTGRFPHVHFFRAALAGARAPGSYCAIGFRQPNSGNNRVSLSWK
jgi:hypothetical protein